MLEKRLQGSGRLMALDVGTKSVGVAVSDPLRLTSRPLTTLRRDRDHREIDGLLELIEQYQVVQLVVGRPVRLSGEESDTLKIVEAFVACVRERCAVPVIWSDERLSSKEAESLMGELGVPAEDRRSRRDEFAAALILQWHLDEKQR